jgi:hypothetical protein
VRLEIVFFTRDKKNVNCNRYIYKSFYLAITAFEQYNYRLLNTVPCINVTAVTGHLNNECHANYFRTSVKMMQLKLIKGINSKININDIIIL